MDANANRDVHVRAARRRQVEDALVFERDRESMLVGELEDILAEAEGPRLDSDLFAQMSPEDAGLVRTALGQDASLDEDEDLDADDGSSWSLEHGYGAAGTEIDEDPAEDVEEEVARLQAEIDSSRRVQAALEKYLELLAVPPA